MRKRQKIKSVNIYFKLINVFSCAFFQIIFLFVKIPVFLYSRSYVFSTKIKIMKEFSLSPIIENFKEIFYRMKSNEIYCNVDIYEEFHPFKYIIKKVDNNLYYESFSFLFNSSIEK